MTWINWGTDIFYSIFFCMITSFCFWVLWKILVVSARKLPSLVFVCYHLIPLGLLCFTPFFFVSMTAFVFFSQHYHTLFPGLILFCSNKQNEIIWIPISIWLAGIFVKCLCRVKDFHSLRKILRDTDNPQILSAGYLLNPELENFTQELTCRFKLSQIPHVKYCAILSAPVVVRMHGFLILLPLRSYSKKELYAILMHEMIHIKHHDLRKLQMGQIFTTVLWFYPIAYLFRRDIELLCETMCDQTVLNSLSEELSYRDYFTAILSHLQPKKVIPSCIGLNNKAQIKYRMSASRSFRHKHFWVSSLSCSILGILLLVNVSITALASVDPIKKVNYDWFDATTIDVEIPYEPPTYTFYRDEEDPDYKNTVFLRDFDASRLIDTRTAHGVNSYSYTLAPGERADDSYIYMTPENIVNIAGTYAPFHASFRIGVTDGTYRSYIYPSGGGFSSSFSIPSSGTYRIFIENTGNISFTVKGSFSF